MLGLENGPSTPASMHRESSDRLRVPTEVPVSSSDSRMLETLAADYWAAAMSRYPTWATSVSVHEHDSRLDDPSPAALDAWRVTLQSFLTRLDALRADGHAPRERVTLAMLRHEVEGGLLMTKLGFEAWSVDQLGGPQVGLLDLVRVHVVTDAKSAATWLDRVRAMPAYVDQHRAN